MTRASLFVVSFLLLQTTLAQPAVHRVPEDFASVLSALDAAFAGDSVLVGPGTWAERDTRTIVIGGGLSPVRASGFIRVGVTLIGTAGSALTMLAGDAVVPGVANRILAVADQGTAGTIRVRGVTLQGQGSPYVAMSTHQATFVFEDCVIEGMGLCLLASNITLEMRSCVIRDNDGTDLDIGHVGISGFQCRMTIEDTLFQRNRGTWLIDSRAASPRRTVILGCTFADNVDALLLKLERSDPLTIENNLFVGNTGLYPTAVCILANECDGVIRGNTFLNNTMTSPLGGAIVMVDSETDIVGNTFYGNVLPPEETWAGAVLIDSDIPLAFTRNVIAGTVGAPAAWRLGTFQPTDGCNIFWDNPAGHFNGYIPRPTDVIADPLFCDPVVGDLTVREGSPCIAGGVPGCGQIGAWGVGCGVVSVEVTSWGRIKTLYRGGDVR